MQNIGDQRQAIPDLGLGGRGRGQPPGQTHPSRCGGSTACPQGSLSPSASAWEPCPSLLRHGCFLGCTPGFSLHPQHTHWEALGESVPLLAPGIWPLVGEIAWLAPDPQGPGVQVPIYPPRSLEGQELPQQQYRGSSALPRNICPRPPASPCVLAVDLFRLAQALQWLVCSGQWLRGGESVTGGRGGGGTWAGLAFRKDFLHYPHSLCCS